MLTNTQLYPVPIKFPLVESLRMEEIVLFGYSISFVFVFLIREKLFIVVIVLNKLVLRMLE